MIATFSKFKKEKVGAKKIDKRNFYPEIINTFRPNLETLNLVCQAFLLNFKQDQRIFLGFLY